MTGAPSSVPSAVVKPQRRVSAFWAVPAVALLLACWLGIRAWITRGIIVTVLLQEGYGLKPGDEVRYRGTAVGEVRDVELTEDLGIRVTAALDRGGERLARSGSRFWVVRPEFGLSRVAGLETLVGPRYLAVLPGRGPAQRRFVGLNEPPVVDAQEPGDLEVILEAAEMGSLRRGAPVAYRQVQVGVVLSVGLASDGGAVEARVHINKAFAQLIRNGTRFWDSGGVEANLGLGGVSLEFQSLESVLAGGIALATPPDAGEVVDTGHRFVLDAEPPEDMLEWDPLVVIGSSMLPPGAPLPNPLRARVDWKRGWWRMGRSSRQGWVLQTEGGLLGPADLLRPEEGADTTTTVLEVAGAAVALHEHSVAGDDTLARLEVTVSDQVWPAVRMRRPREPEDCVAVGDPTSTPLPLSAARLDPQEGVWSVDPELPVDESWHGATVVARRDGFVIGVLLVEDGVAEVALIEAKP